MKRTWTNINIKIGYFDFIANFIFRRTSVATLREPGNSEGGCGGRAGGRRQPVWIAVCWAPRVLPRLQADSSLSVLPFRGPPGLPSTCPGPSSSPFAGQKAELHLGVLKVFRDPPGAKGTITMGLGTTKAPKPF